jgi:hypothetical protein
MTRLVKCYNMQQRTGTKINFRESYDELERNPSFLTQKSLFFKSPYFH